jgi:hypothetical protein
LLACHYARNLFFGMPLKGKFLIFRWTLIFERALMDAHFWMNAHGRSWTLMNAHERSWTLMDAHGRLDANGRSWTLMNAHGSLDAHGRSWTLMDAWTLAGRWLDAGRTLAGRWPDAGWTLAGRLRTFEKFGHATVTVTLQNHKKYCKLRKIDHK